MHRRSTRGSLLLGLAIATCAPTRAHANAPDASVDGGSCVVDAGAGEDASPEDMPSCCTQELCAKVDSVCDEKSCRCDRPACASASTPCKCDLLGNDCPPPTFWCILLGDANNPPSFGTCTPVWWPVQQPEGAPCILSQFCGPGLMCYAALQGLMGVCMRPDCGLSAGAPSCPPGTFCDPMDKLAQMGVCRVSCDRYEELTPCAADEICIQRGSKDACIGVGVSPLPHAGAACVSSGPLQQLCAPGLACANGVCVEACDPKASSPSSPGACPAGRDCVAISGGVCAAPCNPFSKASSSECDEGLYCELEKLPCAGVSGHCLPLPLGGLPELGGSCWDRCGAELACSGGVSPRCLPVCRPGATSSDDGACAGGEHCFGLVDRDSLAQLGYGFCAPACVAGGTDCPEQEWCEPRELDPATNHWIGVCSGYPGSDAGPAVEDGGMGLDASDGSVEAGPDASDGGLDAGPDSGVDAGEKVALGPAGGGCSCRTARPKNAPLDAPWWLGAVGLLAGRARSRLGGSRQRGARRAERQL